MRLSPIVRPRRMTGLLHEGGAVPRRALLHDHELWDCFGGGDAAPEPENLVSTENPGLMELADIEPTSYLQAIFYSL